jgi:hypothetical protein
LAIIKEDKIGMKFRYRACEGRVRDAAGRIKLKSFLTKKCIVVKARFI